MDCGSVHGYAVEKPRLKNVKVIVSRMENTIVLHSLFDENDRYDIDDEIVVDDEETGDAYPVSITSIECGNRRPPFSKVKDIDTIWARSIDEVTVRVAVRRYDVTSSVLQKVPGDFLYVVGGDVKIDGKTYPIFAIKVRGGGFRKKDGDAVPAKKIKRVFTKDLSSGGKNRGGRPYGYGASDRNGRRDPRREDDGLSDRDRRYREWYSRQNDRNRGDDADGYGFDDRGSRNDGPGRNDGRRPSGGSFGGNAGKKTPYRRNTRPAVNRGRK